MRAGLGSGLRGGFAALLIGGLAAMTACKDDKAVAEADGEGTATPIDEAALVSRREALLKTRRSLALRRAELDEKREELAATGEDTASIDEKEDELAAQEQAAIGEFEKFNRELLELLEGQRSAGGPRIVVRESAIAVREKSIGRREKELADRESALAAREVQLATRWKDSCSIGTTMFAPAPLPKGTKYRRGDVEKNLSNASSTMRKRGILASDLPPALANLKRAAQQAMRKGDYAEAYFAADQLDKGVVAMVVNRAFVKAKFDRVRAGVKGNLSDSDAKLLTRITSDYGEGRYKSANSLLNELISKR